MNIFFLDADPVSAAQMLCDKHVGCGPNDEGKRSGGKMIVEAAQMLANCYPLDQLAKAPLTKKGTARKYSYFNHPCSVWVRESYRNFEWLLLHAQSMVEEKQYRGGPRHFTADFIDWCAEFPPTLPKKTITFPALAMPEIYHSHKFVESYRRYYYYDKYLGTFSDPIEVKWTKRENPTWWKDYHGQRS